MRKISDSEALIVAAGSHPTSYASTSPFFIIGAGRSGSTLLRLIITGHSGIEIPPETWFILDLVRKFPLGDRLSDEEVYEVVKIVTEDYRWPDMAMETGLFSKCLSGNMLILGNRLCFKGGE